MRVGPGRNEGRGSPAAASDDVTRDVREDRGRGHHLDRRIGRGRIVGGGAGGREHSGHEHGGDEGAAHLLTVGLLKMIVNFTQVWLQVWLEATHELQDADTGDGQYDKQPQEA